MGTRRHAIINYPCNYFSMISFYFYITFDIAKTAALEAPEYLYNYDIAFN